MNTALAPRIRGTVQARSKRTRVAPLPLINGDRLNADEFLRRYEAMPEIKKAELIDGIVYIMASPLRFETHGDPDHLMQMVIGFYEFATPGVWGSSNATTRLGHKDIPQPDLSLRCVPERTGKEQSDSAGYLKIKPKLVVEIAASSASIDMHAKHNSYLRAEVQEYIVWCTLEPQFHWWQLVDSVYAPISPGKDGISRSHVFPGLWLDTRALMAYDRLRAKAVLEMGLKSKEHAAFVGR